MLITKEPDDSGVPIERKVMRYSDDQINRDIADVEDWNTASKLVYPKGSGDGWRAVSYRLATEIQHLRREREAFIELAAGIESIVLKGK